DRDPVQLLLHHDGGHVEQRQHHRGVPQRLVLGGDQRRTVGDMLATLDDAVDAGDGFQQPVDAARPELADGDDGALFAQRQRQQTAEGEQGAPAVEGRLEEQRTDGEDHEAVPLATEAGMGPPATRLSSRARSRAARYLVYSPSRKTVAVWRRHQSSTRSVSERTAWGTMVTPGRRRPNSARLRGIW